MQKISYYWGKFVQLYLTPKIIKNCVCGENARICSGSIINDVTIGDCSYIGHNCSINNCDIGKYCSIAGECIIGGSSHPVNWVSTSPVFHAPHNVTGKYIGSKVYITKKQTVIGNDVWIGSRVIIKAGIKIGDGAVIGMGSVVTKDIPPYEIWAGNPAKMIKSRYNECLKDKIQNSHWWDLEEEVLKKLAMNIDNPVDFVNKLNDQD